METDFSIWRKAGHFYFAFDTKRHRSACMVENACNLYMNAHSQTVLAQCDDQRIGRSSPHAQ